MRIDSFGISVSKTYKECLLIEDDEEKCKLVDLCISLYMYSV